MDGMRIPKLCTAGWGRYCPRYYLLPLILMVAAGVAAVESPATAQELFVDPSISLPTSIQFTVDIAIDCAGQEVKGVETTLTFDPLLVTLDAITPGPWYTDSGLDYFFYDYTPVDPPGTIHFASSVLDGTNNQSLSIAVCHFTAVTFGSTPVDFQDVDVRGPENMDLGFGHSTGDMIHIDQVVADTSTTFGRLKVLFR